MAIFRTYPITSHLHALSMTLCTAWRSVSRSTKPGRICQTGLDGQREAAHD